MNTNFKIDNFKQLLLSDLSGFLNKNSEIYVIGGCLRDCLLNKETFDIDIIVKGQNAIELAKNFADKTERYFLILDEKYEIARVVDKDKLHYFDFARCENDDIIVDLNRRDLTINTICLKLFPNIEIINKLNGENDFQNKIVKMVNEQNLIDDPLRILRVYRFASLLNFDIESETLNAVKNHVALINNVAHERVLTELFKLLEGKNSAKYLNSMKNDGLLYEIFPILSREKNIPPNSHHHLCLIDHSVETVHQLEKLLDSMPDFVTEKLNSYQTNGIKYLSLLKLACLLHDVGKPDTWTIEENGRHRFINHDSVGAELLKPILKEKKFSKTQIKYITTLVKNHIYPSQLARETEIASDKVIHRMFRKLEDCTIDVLLLAMADRLSAQGAAITKEMTENNINTLTKYLFMYENFIKTEKPLPKLLDGNEISEILNIPKDKELGKIVKKLHEEQLNGNVKSIEDAVEFLKNIL